MQQKIEYTWIVATDQRGVIGLRGKTPWWIPGELTHFRERTMGRPVVVGRETYEAIGQPLEGRPMVVMTRQSGYAAQHARVAHSVEDARGKAEAEAHRLGVSEVIIAGGAQIYEVFQPIVTRVCVTVVGAVVEGDRRVGLDWFRASRDWSCVDRREVAEHKRSGWRHTYEEWVKKR